MRKLIFLGLYLAFVIPCQAKIIYVDVNTPDNNDGSSWAKAYKYLQDALADANSSGDVNEIRVAQGSYRPDECSVDPNGTGDRTATFQLNNGIALRGGYAGYSSPDPNAHDIQLYETILSGDLDCNDVEISSPADLPNESSRGENSYHVVSILGAVEATTILDGFTITGGYANNDDAPPYDVQGGGIYGTSVSNLATISNCIISENFAQQNGGGTYLCRGSGTDCAITRNCAFCGGGVTYGGSITKCTVSYNCSYDVGGRGGGLYACSGPINNCTIRNNSARYGGGIEVWGTISITDCIFTSNSGTFGGAIDNYGACPRISNCTFTGNGATWGGGICNFEGSPIVTNCVFSKNMGSTYPYSYTGGGVDHVNGYSSAAYVNCTFVDNSVGLGVSYGSPPSDLTVQNCIFWENEQSILNNTGSTITVTYSDMQGGWAGSGGNNIDTDPCFADPTNGDYHLKSQAGRYDPRNQIWIEDAVTSLCIDAGDPESSIGWEITPNGARVNMGAYGGTWQASKSYFGQPVCSKPIVGDIDGDCKVDFVDFAFMASHWLEDNR
jgi:hypothetical protein